MEKRVQHVFFSRLIPEPNIIMRENGGRRGKHTGLGKLQFQILDEMRSEMRSYFRSY